MLIYGPVPRAVGYCDTVWATLVDAGMLSGKTLDGSMTDAAQDILKLAETHDIGTWNALFVNFFDDKDLDKIWFVGKGEVLVRADRCLALLEKVKVMGVGEALADSDLGTYEADVPETATTSEGTGE